MATFYVKIVKNEPICNCIPTRTKNLCNRPNEFSYDLSILFLYVQYVKYTNDSLARIFNQNVCDISPTLFYFIFTALPTIALIRVSSVCITMGRLCVTPIHTHTHILIWRICRRNWVKATLII